MSQITRIRFGSGIRGKTTSVPRCGARDSSPSSACARRSGPAGATTRSASPRARAFATIMAPSSSPAPSRTSARPSASNRARPSSASPRATGASSASSAPCKEQLLWLRRFGTVAELDAAQREFRDRFNQHWTSADWLPNPRPAPPRTPRGGRVNTRIKMSQKPDPLQDPLRQAGGQLHGVRAAGVHPAVPAASRSVRQKLEQGKHYRESSGRFSRADCRLRDLEPDQPTCMPHPNNCAWIVVVDPKPHPIGGSRLG